MFRIYPFISFMCLDFAQCCFGPRGILSRILYFCIMSLAFLWFLNWVGFVQLAAYDGILQIGFPFLGKYFRRGDQLNKWVLYKLI